MFPVLSSAFRAVAGQWARGKLMGKECLGSPGATPFTDHIVPIGNREGDRSRWKSFPSEKNGRGKSAFLPLGFYDDPPGMHVLPAERARRAG